jgi:hypothetical protein
MESRHVPNGDGAGSVKPIAEKLKTWWEANGTDLALWRRSRVKPLCLSEIMLLVALLAFSLVIPVFLIPATVAILVYIGDKFGFTFLGNAILLVTLMVPLAIAFGLLAVS